ncbi:MAG: glycosyltransferase family 4 protein [Dehalococcoidia bacterium]
MSAPRVSLVLEQTLGHRTHTQNIERVLESHGRHAVVHHIDYGDGGRVPWALRASAKALGAIRGERAGVTFFHTQTVSLFAQLATGGRPYVVSVDATPVQVDSMARWYEHRPGSRAAERAKRAWYRSVFSGAAAIVSWSEWAADSVRADYGVRTVPIEVVHPGAPDALFEIVRSGAPGRRPTVLFVGGDFERKGGPQLVQAFEPLSGRADLVLMTDASISVPPWVRVLRGVRAGTPEHRRAFAEADLFCLPTLGDCTPLVLGEAMAAGLPVLTTAVGSNEETVGPDAGLLVAPGDVDALRAALRDLVEQPARLASMGEAARARANQRMNAGRNAERILELLEHIADRGTP